MSRSHLKKLFCIQGALSFAYTVLPCAGGTDPGRSQREDQVDLLIHTCNTNMTIKLVPFVNTMHLSFSI